MCVCVCVQVCLFVCVCVCVCVCVYEVRACTSPPTNTNVQRTNYEIQGANDVRVANEGMSARGAGGGHALGEGGGGGGRTNNAATAAAASILEEKSFELDEIDQLPIS